MQRRSSFLCSITVFASNTDDPFANVRGCPDASGTRVPVQNNGHHDDDAKKQGGGGGEGRGGAVETTKPSRDDKTGLVARGCKVQARRN